MNDNAEFASYVLDLLHQIQGISSRRMFGGTGFFVDGVMFAIGAGEELYFKVDDDLIPGYEAFDRGPFIFQSTRGDQALKTYYQLPAEIFDDIKEITEWAERSIAAAMRADAEKPPSKRKRKAARPMTAKELSDLP